MQTSEDANVDVHLTYTDVKNGWSAWYALGVLVVVVIFGFIDRQIIVLVVEPIKRDLALTDFQIGSIQGLAPALFAVLAGVPLAWLADRTDRRLLLIACILFWSSATAARGLSDGFSDLLLFTVGIAVGEAVLTPIIYSLIPDLFSKNKRQLANIIFYATTVVGVGIGLMIGGTALASVEVLRPHLPAPIDAMAGWRLAFFLVAAPGLLLALLVLPISARRSELPPQSAVAGENNCSLSQYFKRNWRPVALVYSGMGFYAAGAAAVSVWLPVALIRDLQAPAAEVGIRFGSAFTAAGLIGVSIALIGAPAWRRLIGPPHVVRAMSTAMAVCVVPLVAIGFVQTPGLAYILCGVFFCILIIGTAFSPSLLQDMAPPRLRARVAAFSMISYTVLGSSTPMLVGMLSDVAQGKERALLMIVVSVGAVSLALAALLFRLAEPSLTRLQPEIG